MAYELKDGQGSLWKNEKRESDTHAHAKGQAKIGGVIYWVDAWTNETADGKKYQTLKFKPKDDQPRREPSRQINDEPDDGEAIPF